MPSERPCEKLGFLIWKHIYRTVCMTGIEMVKNAAIV
nr:MAG TPA: hypothetical protein [Caudoviricetes sp.]